MMDYFHFWLPAINGGILAIFPLALIALTKRNHMVSCVILGVIVTEYVAIMGDSGLMMELFAGFLAYVNPKGMFDDFVKHVKYINTHS